MVKPWTDMLAYDELRKGGPGDPFIVKELITERKIDGDHLECINELTDNFNPPPPSRKGVDSNRDGVLLNPSNSTITD